MISVLLKENNKVLGFPDDMPKDEIEHHVKGFLYGEVSQGKEPTFFDEHIRPWLKENTGWQDQVILSDRPPSAERAFAGTAVKSLSFGIINPPNLEKDTNAFPIQATAGNIAGAVGNLAATGKALVGMGLGKAAEGLAIGVTEKAIPVISEKAMRFIPPAIMGGATFGTSTGIRTAVEQAQTGEIDPIKWGGAVIKDTALGTLMGGISGISSAPVAVSTAAGLGYTSAKMDGASEEDALLSGAIWGTFEVVGSFGRERQLREKAVDHIVNSLSDYAQAKNPKLQPGLADSLARSYVYREAQKVGGIEKVVSDQANTLAFLEKVNAHIRKTKPEVKPEQGKLPETGINVGDPNNAPMVPDSPLPVSFVNIKGSAPENLKDLVDNPPIVDASFSKTVDEMKELLHMGESPLLLEDGNSGYFRTPSTNPDFFVDSGISKKEIIKIIDNVKSGEAVTPVQLDNLLRMKASYESSGMIGFMYPELKGEPTNTELPPYEMSATQYSDYEKSLPPQRYSYVPGKESPTGSPLYGQKAEVYKALKNGADLSQEAAAANYELLSTEQKAKAGITPDGYTVPGDFFLKRDAANDNKVSKIVPAKTPDDLKKRIEQLNKYAQSNAILRKAGGIKKPDALGQFVSGGSTAKEGEVRLRKEVVANEQDYFTVLAHELGHALEHNFIGKTNDPRFRVFGDDLNAETLKKLRSELIAVSKELVGEQAYKDKIEYFSKPAELVARFFEKMMTSPGNLQEMAPTAVELIEKQAIKHPIIAEFIEAARGAIDKGSIPSKFVFLKDLKQTYQKLLGNRVGRLAYNADVVTNLRVEQAKYVIENFIKTKFKGVKDKPDLLFKAAESIKISRQGVPEYGTRDFVVAKSSEEETALVENGWEKTPKLVLEDGKEYPQYARNRYTPEQAKVLFDSLSPEGKQLILDFTAARDEAKDYFNREVIKDTHKINSDLEGWVHHYFEDKGGNIVQGGPKLKQGTAGARKHREGATGYVEDFKVAMTKAMTDLNVEKIKNDFIEKQFARISKPIVEGQEPDPGWIEVVGDVKKGVGTQQEKKMVIIQDGETIVPNRIRYQIPKEIYHRYQLWRGLVEEAGLGTQIISDINRYWQVNILATPAFMGTNFISGGIQYSAKILTDFYSEVLTGDIKLEQTRKNITAMVEVLTPRGWKDTPDWAYGNDLSNFYGQFGKQKGAVFTGAVDTYGQKIFRVLGIVERYWKKVILLSEAGHDISKFNQVTKEGLVGFTKEEEEMLAALNEQVDLYAYDYNNVAPWLEAHIRNPFGQAVKPFMKYPYKYAKQILNMAGSVFDRTMPVQERIAKLLALTTLVSLYSFYSNEQKKKQETPESDVNIPATYRTQGRLFIGKDKDRNEVFTRVGKYPFLNISEAGIQFSKGNTESARGLVQDMIGSIGPLAKMSLNLMGYSSDFEKYDPLDVKLGKTMATFVPFSRVLNSTSQALDKYRRKQENFGQTFTSMIPVTSKDLQLKLHGKVRTENIPVDKFKNEKGNYQTTREEDLLNNRMDIVVGALTGVYVSRLDPEKVKAYTQRGIENKEKQEKKKD
jgi:hypothetical protein